MKRYIAALLAVGLLLTASAAVALAGPPDQDRPLIPRHKHILVMPDGDEIEVGPDACASDEIYMGAFQNFHYNIHHGTADKMAMPNEFAFQQDGNPVGFKGVPYPRVNDPLGDCPE